MQKSRDRIFVTHAGSLPRGEPLGSMLIDQEAGRTIENAALKKAIEARVTHVLNKQIEVGIDDLNDGEQGRIGFQTYVAQRIAVSVECPTVRMARTGRHSRNSRSDFSSAFRLASERSTTLLRPSPISNTKARSTLLLKPSG